jgi:hypothetical protein
MVNLFIYLLTDYPPMIYPLKLRKQCLAGNRTGRNLVKHYLLLQFTFIVLLIEQLNRFGIEILTQH